MENKIIEKGLETQAKVIRGIKKAAGAVKTTLGPAGRCVAIQSGFGVPEVTRDGVTVAKAIKLSDPYENMGSELLKRAAEDTERACGDATSTTAVLIEEMCKRGQRALTTGANVNEIKSGMDKALKYVLGYIKGISTPVDGDLEKVRKVATISANNDPEVGDLIVQIMEKIGTGATITTDMSATLDTVIDVVQGMKIDKGWVSPLFVTEAKSSECTMIEPNVAIVGEKISNVQQIIPLLESNHKAGNKPLLLIVDDIDETVIQMLAFNIMQGALSACVVKGIDFGDGRKNLMQDIATFTGATYICPENGNDLAQFSMNDFGKVEKAVIGRDSTILTGGYGNPDEIQKRAEIIQARLDDPKTSSYDRHKFEGRLSNLTGGIGVIKVGGATEVERQNKKATIDDAILASKSALAEGVVPGSGYVLFWASREGLKNTALFKDMTPNERDGATIVFESLPEIMKTIAKNAGMDGEVVLEKVKNHAPGKGKGPWGLNAKTKKFGDLSDFGILDSAKVLRVSVENSVSTASMVLLIDCTITNEPKKDECGCGERIERGQFG